MSSSLKVAPELLSSRLGSIISLAQPNGCRKRGAKVRSLVRFYVKGRKLASCEVNQRIDQEMLPIRTFLKCS